MVPPGRDHRSRRRRLVNAGTGLFIAAMAWALAAVPVFGQTKASLELSPPRTVVGQKIALRIRTDLPWQEGITIDSPELDSPLIWWALPYARPWGSAGADGTTTRRVEILGTLRADGPGFLYLGPFRVTAGEDYAYTDPVTIVSLAEDEREFRYPVEVAFRTPPSEVWQGQSVPVILSAQNLVSLAIPEEISFAEPPPGLVQAADGHGAILTRPFDDDILYDVPLGSWVWTPGEPGETRFPRARVTFDGIDRRVAGFSVTVLPLPPEVEATGAVGRFRISVTGPQEPLPAGGTATITIRVEGDGNLNVLRLPVPEVFGAIPAGESEQSSYRPGPDGFEGWRETRYDFQIVEPGDYEVEIPSWVWLDPRAGNRVRRTSPSTATIRIVPAAVEEESDDGPALLGTEAVRKRQARFTWRNPYWFLLVLPGALFSLAVFLFRNPRSRVLAAVLVLPFLVAGGRIPTDKEIELAVARVAAEEGRYDESYQQYRELLDAFPDQPGILHDAAVVMDAKGRTDLAVYALRRSLHLRPGDQRLRRTLAEIESRRGLDDQVNPPLPWPPWVVFAIFLVAVNGFFASFSLRMGGRSAREIILSVSALILLVVAGGAIAISEMKWRVTTAVVLEGAEPLRKIPGPLATDLLDLTPGTTVVVNAVTEGGCLVISGYGLEGWMPRESLLFVDEDENGFRIDS